MCVYPIEYSVYVHVRVCACACMHVYVCMGMLACVCVHPSKYSMYINSGTSDHHVKP